MKSKKPIESLILNLRGQKVILDADLAELYEVPTKRLNEQVKRNADRFPEDFIFQLTAPEFENLKSQIATSSLAADEDQEVAPNWSQIATSSSKHRGAAYRPWAFTEHGAIMAATVLNSPAAVAMSVFVVRAFMQMREQLAANAAMLKRLAEIDKTLLEHDSALRTVWTKLQPLLAPPPPRSLPPHQGFQPRPRMIALKNHQSRGRGYPRNFFRPTSRAGRPEAAFRAVRAHNGTSAVAPHPQRGPKGRLKFRFNRGAGVPPAGLPVADEVTRLWIFRPRAPSLTSAPPPPAPGRGRRTQKKERGLRRQQNMPLPLTDPFTDKFDDANLPGERQVTITLKKVFCGTELNIVQEGVPDAIPAEACYLGWQESLILLAKLVEAEIPD